MYSYIIPNSFLSFLQKKGQEEEKEKTERKEDKNGLEERVSGLLSLFISSFFFRKRRRKSERTRAGRGRKRGR